MFEWGKPWASIIRNMRDQRHESLHSHHNPKTRHLTSAESASHLWPDAGRTGKQEQSCSTTMCKKTGAAVQFNEGHGAVRLEPSGGPHLTTEGGGSVSVTVDTSRFVCTCSNFGKERRVIVTARCSSDCCRTVFASGCALWGKCKRGEGEGGWRC